jgi:hypothetical protein
MNLDITFEGCEHDDAGIRKLAANGNHGIDAPDIGQSEIHECNVRPMLAKTQYGISAAGRFSNQQHVWFIPDDGRDSFSHQRMIVDAQDPDLVRVAHSCSPFFWPWPLPRTFPVSAS